MNRLHLPVVQPEPASFHEGSLGKDGRRRRPYPADVTGRWVTRRRIVYALLILVWAALPWIPVGGHPAVFLDVAARRFFLFGFSANAQDTWLVFFAVTGLGFGLVYTTALLGRAWCGWACPQTVFAEALFRPVERFFQGPRNIALRRASGPMTFDRAWRTAATHAGWILSALLVAHVFLAYFVSLPGLFRMVRSAPTSNPEAFGWMLGVTALFYASFGLFREQFCVVVCPYGRLQSVLLDDDSLVVGYDRARGEPRGKVQAAPDEAADASPRGDCVDCGRCVVVCPTGIDIRDGLQLDCIACTACIDACDDVMDRLGRPRGLIRYDATTGLRGEPRRILRPRIVAYTALLLVGAAVAAFALVKRVPFEANLLRLPGAPYTRDGEVLRNGFELHLANKDGAPRSFHVEPEPGSGLAFVVPVSDVMLDPLERRRVPVFVTAEASAFRHDVPFTIRVSREGGPVLRPTAVFLGATSPGGAR